MGTTKIFWQIILAAFWLAVGAGMLTLLIAAIGKKNKQVCSDYRVVIKGTGNHFFVDKQEVLDIMGTAMKGIKGAPLASFDLRKLEELLERNAWIKNAELYFDNRCVLHASITERQPVARVFTRAGLSFYIDSSGKPMPLAGKPSVRVPVFTGYPDKKIMSGKEAELVKQVKNLAVFITANSFWKAQVAQMDISGGYQFEMVPVIGNHLVKLGEGRDIEAKFNRLYQFYKQVSGKAGFDKYPVIDVQYAGQVVATKKADK